MRRINQQILDEASDWAVRTDAGALSPAERKNLADWLKASPVHLEEYLLASAILCGLSEVEISERIGLDNLIGASGAEIVQIDAIRSPEPTSSGQAPDRSRNLFRAIMALAAACLLGLLVWSSMDLASPGAESSEVFKTALGEQRTVQLSDGSLVYLNTQTELTVHLAANERRVDLIRGEAMFDIESDPDRPFRVVAGDTIAEALGTVFNVRLVQDAAIVSVVEGKVKVDQIEKRSARTTGRTGSSEDIRDESAKEDTDLVLSIGDTASVRAAHGDIDLSETEVDSIVSWRARKIVFERQPLSWIVDEFNRYNRTKLIVSDPDLADQRFSGTFDADDPDSFAQFLAQHYNMRTVQVGGQTYLEPQN